MKFRTVAFCLVLAGCTSGDPRPTDELSPVADPFLAAAEDVDDRPIAARIEQPQPYSAIIEANYALEQFRFLSNTRQLRLTRRGEAQRLLPQITPAAGINSGEGPAISVSIDQVLYDGGETEARLFAAESAAIEQHILLLDGLNAAISEDLGLYFDFHENREAGRLFQALSDQIEELRALAETRLAGGISSANELTLFQLNKSEIETEAQIARSRSDLSVQLLDTIGSDAIAVPPKGFKTDRDGLPIPILAALAERELRRSDLELQEVARRPQVVVTGNASVTIPEGTVGRGLGLEVRRNRPIPLTGNTELALAKENLDLAQRDLERTIQETELQLSSLQAEIDALLTQQGFTDGLAEQAQGRLDGFQEQFLAGTASLSEAAGLIDTLRRTREEQVSIKYRILRLQAERAALLGSFLP